jgi:hypothetical protein
MQQSEENLLAVEGAGVEAYMLLVGVGLSAITPNAGVEAQQAADGAGAKGLANPFKGKSAGEIDKIFKGKGFDPRGPTLRAGRVATLIPKRVAPITSTRQTASESLRTSM